MRRLLILMALASAFTAGGLIAQGGVGPIGNLMGRVDSNNALIVTAAAAGTTGAATAPIANLLGKVDSSNNLLVTVAGGTMTPNSLCLDATNQDTCLVRDGAADTLAQQRGTNAQTFRIYNTFTNATNYERTDIGWSSNRFNINTTALGTGTQRALQFQIGSSDVMQINTSGNIIFNNDNARDIGASGTTRPRSGFFGTSVVAPFHNSSTVSALTVTTNTIAPTSTIHQLGAGLIKTITVPAGCTPTCTIFIEPTAAYTYDATGNIILPAGGGTAVIGKLMVFAWQGTKWVPSY
jgi:hypothetical protein